MMCCSSSAERERGREVGGAERRWTPLRLTPFCSLDRYQKLWKSYVKLRHLLANSPKVKQIDKQKLMQREVGRRQRQRHPPAGNMPTLASILSAKPCLLHINISIAPKSNTAVFDHHDPASSQMGAVGPPFLVSVPFLQMPFFCP